MLSLSLLLGFQVGFRVHLKLGCLLFSESEVKECCFLWLIGSASRCLLVQRLDRLNLVSTYFPTSDPLSSSFPSAFVSRNTVVSFVLVWIQFDLCQLGIFVNYSIDSLGWLLQGEFVIFPWSFH